MLVVHLVPTDFGMKGCGVVGCTFIPNMRSGLYSVIIPISGFRCGEMGSGVGVETAAEDVEIGYAEPSYQNGYEPYQGCYCSYSTFFAFYHS